MISTTWKILGGALLLTALAHVAAAADPAVGSPAPPFRLPGTDGSLHALEDHIGKRAVVLAWFPKAFTPG